ncbi:RNA 2',3'-cyclic phosphodiesterase [Ilumatobacter sp.]|uniref:RNA 2',3'-cyclic phosphodiesterase n=1 Tax=Ilumatobacter sp. TaxID=1967498 RepID=UPI003B52D9B4
MSRLFVCLWPPDDVVDALCELHRKDQVGARFVPPENWHVTLRFLGDADPAEVAHALEGADLPPAFVELGPAVDIGDRGTLFVPATGAAELARSVVDATRGLGDAPVRRRFLGHVTLGRVRRGANVPRVLGDLVHASWEPARASLVESTLRPTGARYETLRTFPIGRGSTDPDRR